MLLRERREDVEKPRQFPHRPRRAGARRRRRRCGCCCCARITARRWIFPMPRLAEARRELDRFYRALERTPAPPADAVPDAGAGGAVRRPEHAAGHRRRCTRWPMPRWRATPRPAAGCAPPARARACCSRTRDAWFRGGVGCGRHRGARSPNAWRPAAPATSPAPTRSARELADEGHRAGGRPAAAPPGGAPDPKEIKEYAIRPAARRRPAGRTAAAQTRARHLAMPRTTPRVAAAERHALHARLDAAL